jgi:hypothetical protein
VKAVNFYIKSSELVDHYHNNIRVVKKRNVFFLEECHEVYVLISEFPSEVAVILCEFSEFVQIPMQFSLKKFTPLESDQVEIEILIGNPSFVSLDRASIPRLRDHEQ